MPLLLEQIVNSTTKLAVWHITETESFFSRHVSVQRQITHPHKRLQHLAGKYLLQFLYPDFPHQLIMIADTKKPFLENEAYHFSISHSGDYAAAIVSTDHRVGLDVELYSPKVKKIMHKFLREDELAKLKPSGLKELTTLWSAKEAIFKWYGQGDVDFKENICMDEMGQGVIEGRFVKEDSQKFEVNYVIMDEIVLAYTYSPAS